MNHLPRRPQRQTLRRQLYVTRGAMFLLAGVAVWLTITGNRSLVEIGRPAYAAIGLLAPGVFLGFLWSRASAIAALAGIVVRYVALLAPQEPHTAAAKPATLRYRGETRR